MRRDGSLIVRCIDDGGDVWSELSYSSLAAVNIEDFVEIRSKSSGVRVLTVLVLDSGVSSHILLR